MLMKPEEMMAKTKSMIDDLKAVLATFGLSNSAGSYKIITELFMYKFLNDKFFYEVRLADDRFKDSANIEADLEKLSDDEYEFLLMSLPPAVAQLKKEHFISYLFNRKNEEKFHELFDATFEDISNFNLDVFSVRTGSNEPIKLFEPFSNLVTESGRRADFCRAMIDKLVSFSFEGAFGQKYDFFAAIYEYLIKDYNKDFGSYAEYYTPHNIATIIAKIIAPNGDDNVSIYDPAAGSGTLVLALAHQIGEENCTIYTQDISQKSNEFMRLNLILNGLVHSLGNVIHGDTLLTPHHKEKDKLKKFDYIVSNPPFNIDFSDIRDTLLSDTYKERFWAGVPNIPNKEKEKMPVYLMFLQHILYSLNEVGKAAIVVPTGFLTVKNGIGKMIRQYIIDKKILKGVISMPPNIFATTGTNVSILVIDKELDSNKVLLLDASDYGTKIKVDGKNQRTILDNAEIDDIIDIFNNKRVVEKKSVIVDFEKIEQKKYSLSATQYFEAKLEYRKFTPEEFDREVDTVIKKLQESFIVNDRLNSALIDKLRGLNYDT